MITEIELVLVAMIYAGAAIAMIRAVLLRGEALRAWRREIGGAYDARQHRFVTELDLDRAKLPPKAARKLLESRRVLVAGFAALAIALVLNVFVLRVR